MAFLRPLLLGWSCFIAACFSPSPADPEVAESGSSEFSQYSGTTACEATCALIPPGTEDDMLGNTVGCRIHHTILAGEQPDPHCFHSGPAGDGTCGAACESFCTIALQVCTGDLTVWPNAEACIADCTMFAEEPKLERVAPRRRHLRVSAQAPHAGLAAARRALSAHRVELRRVPIGGQSA